VSGRTKAVIIGVQVLVVAAVLAALFALGSSSPDGDGEARSSATAPAPAPAPRVDRFDGDRAFGLLRTQVQRFGPRPAGSAASRRTAEWARRQLPRGRFEAIPRHPRLRNVVGVLPGRRPAVVVAAHYDTEATVPGHVGANDGAAGTAAVLELARAMRARRAPAGAREVRFVLFDGEEEPKGCPDGEFYACALRGSKAYAARHARQVGELVLLDYIAEKGTRIPQEGTSDPELWARLRAAAARVGAERTFPDLVGPAIIDDHTPFLRRGVTAIDLIDFDYPVRDTTEDDLDAVSAASLDAVGETVLELLTELRRG
jgi:glutaminyl-peptide cyclotransferase